MSDRYGSSRPPRRDYDDRPRTSAQRPSGAGYNTSSHRSTSARPASRPPQGAARPASRSSSAARPASRPSQGSGRPASRPPQSGARRPAPRRRKKSPVPAIIAILVIIALIVGVIVIISNTGKDKKSDNNPGQAAVSTAVDQPFTENTGIAGTEADPAADAAADPAGASALASYLDGEDVEVQGLSEEEMVKVANLSINENLPEEWMNILLLGTDARDPNASARSDTIMICSINKNTGAVKLTSIMRDLAVEFKNVGRYSGTYRINAANYFGGPEYTMKIVNECFGMNIQHYVSINFYGFQEIAHALGGITVDITEAEMVEINKYVWSAHVVGTLNNLDNESMPLVELTTYGENTKLDGRQTLAYARIRKTDNDFSRAGRQREVLGLLANQLKTKNPAEITMMLARFTNFVQTNLEFDTAASIAMKVLQGDLSDIGSFRLPVNGSYNQTSKNGKSMFYDCDWALNSRELYTFIYG